LCGGCVIFFPPIAQSPERNMRLGYVKLYRRLLDSRIFQNEGLLQAFIYCLLKVNHEKQWVGLKTGIGRTEVRVKEGQFIFGRVKAGKETKTAPSTIEWRIKKLEKLGIVNRQPESHYTLISVINWNTYQSPKEEKLTGTWQALNTNKNDKNDKKYILPSKKASSKEKVISFKQEDYDHVLADYQRLKGIILKGKEIIRFKSSVKDMFLSDRSVEDIIGCMKYLNSDDFLKDKWQITTVQKRLPEFVAGKTKKDWQYAK